jgi:hypothetical protein
VFQKTHMGVIKKTAPAITMMATATPTVTPNLTPEEFVKFMDVAVASKYRNDLMNFTRTITEEVCSTLDTFKTDLQNTLPQQIRLVMQQVHGESQGEQLDLEPSTPYPGSTSALGNTGTLSPGNTTASGNPGNIASTSTLHPGNTLGNVIYIDASSPYLGVFRWEIHVLLRLLIYLTRGARPLRVIRGFQFTPHHTDQPKPELSATVLPNHGLRSQHTSHGYRCCSRSYSQHIFPRTPAYVTPNLRIEGEVNDGVRHQISSTLRELGFTPKGQARCYQKLYSVYFYMIPYPRGFWVPDLAKIMGDDAKTTYEHIG